MREGVLLELDIETAFAITQWIRLAGISDGFLLRGISGKQLNQGMDAGQISRVLKLIAVKAYLDPKKNQWALDAHWRRSGLAGWWRKHWADHGQGGVE